MTSISIAKCQFIGNHSDHFATGHWYELEIINHMFGKITATPTQGNHYKPMQDFSVRYVSLHHFLHDWRIEQLLHDGYWGGAVHEIS